MSKTTPAAETPAATTEVAPFVVDMAAIDAEVMKESHPAANIFPLMNAEDFNNLVLSIRMSGFDPAKPIKRVNGKITDGRNRERAVRFVNAESADWNAKNPKDQREMVQASYHEVQIDDANILSSVLADNLARRHLNASQKAAVLVKADILSQALARKKELGEVGKRIKGDITKLLAEQHQVNVDYVYKMKTINKHAQLGKQLMKAVADGEMTVMAAWKKMQDYDAEQAGGGTGGTGGAGDGSDESGLTIKDGLGRAVPSDFSEQFEVRALYTEAAKMMRELNKKVAEIGTKLGGAFLIEGTNQKDFKAAIGTAAKILRNTEPHCICPHCEGSGKNPAKPKQVCPVCGGAEIVTEPTFEFYTKNGVPGDAEPVTEELAPASKKKAGKKAEAEAELAAAGMDKDGFPLSYQTPEEKAAGKGGKKAGKKAETDPEPQPV